MNSPNTKNTCGQHGGNLSWIANHYPHAPTPLIDLSTCINPYFYTLPAPAPEWNHHLPDAALMQTLHQAVANHCHIGENNVVLASGMQPLMVALAARRLKQYGVSNVAIVSPTYSEHEHVWNALGHICVPYKDGGHYDVVIICNPNNPDGRVVAPEPLLQLAKHHSWLIVDESFADLKPEASMASSVQQHDNIVILRSCGKFFGVAGIRASFALASESFIQNIRTLLGPWPVSTAACHLLPIMLKDNLWAENMRRRLHAEADAWHMMLAQHFSIIGHTALFTLVETDRAEERFMHLASQGILVRRFDYNKRWLRIGLPDSTYTNRLQKALLL